MLKWIKFAAACLACLPLVAQAQWPQKPIRALVTTSPGGMLDGTTRVIAKKLSEVLGQPVIVENKPGASGVIAAGQTVSSPADGYTLLFDTSAFSVTPALRKTPYDPAKDFTPVLLVGAAPMMLVVPSGSPLKTPADLIKAAQKSPGQLTFASAGTGLATHLAFELFEQKADIQMVHVPYKGGAPAMVDIIAGRVSSAFTLAATTLPFVKDGKVRVLAVSSSTRIPELPDVPTLAESTIPQFDVHEWNGIFIRSGTSPDVLARLSKALATVMQDPEVKKELRAVGLEPQGLGSAEFGSFIVRERTRWQALVKERGITM